MLREYGEERFASRIADAIVRERAKAPFTSSAALVEIVRDAIPAATRRTGGNPAKRTFQALRIEVNGELAVLERAIPAALDALAVGGRIVVLAYQSLEDRIVKRALAAATASTVPPDLPFIPEGSEPRAAPAGAGLRGSVRGRGRGQPASGLGTAARRRACAGGGVNPVTNLPLRADPPPPIPPAPLTPYRSACPLALAAHHRLDPHQRALRMCRNLGLLDCRGASCGFCDPEPSDI